MSPRIFDTGTEDLRTEISEGVMTITLNRPERRNALSDAMLEGLIASLADAETATDVGSVLLTGAGGAFCAGGDVKGMAASGGEGGWSVRLGRAAATSDLSRRFRVALAPGARALVAPHRRCA